VADGDSAADAQLNPTSKSILKTQNEITNANAAIAM
jgi:hypothetical protein